MNLTTGGASDKKLVYSMVSPEPDDPADIAFSNLYPAVTECFVIILCG